MCLFANFYGMRRIQYVNNCLDPGFGGHGIILWLGFCPHFSGQKTSSEHLGCFVNNEYVFVLFCYSQRISDGTPTIHGVI